MKLRARPVPPILSSAVNKPKKIKKSTKKNLNSVHRGDRATLTGLPPELECMVIHYLSDLDVKELLFASFGFETTQLEISRHVQLCRTTPPSLSNWSKPTLQFKDSFVHDTIIALFSNNSLALVSPINEYSDSVSSLSPQGHILQVRLKRTIVDKFFQWTYTDLSTGIIKEGIYGYQVGNFAEDHEHTMYAKFANRNTSSAIICLADDVAESFFNVDTLQASYSSSPIGGLLTNCGRWRIVGSGHETLIYDTTSEDPGTPRTIFHLCGDVATSRLLSLDESILFVNNPAWSFYKVIYLEEDSLPEASEVLEQDVDFIPKRFSKESMVAYFADNNWIGFGIDATGDTLFRCGHKGRDILCKFKAHITSSLHSLSGRFVVLVLSPGNRFVLFDLQSDRVVKDVIEDEWDVQDVNLVSVANDGSFLVEVEQRVSVVHHSIRGRVAAYIGNPVTCALSEDGKLLLRSDAVTRVPVVQRLMR
jgi:hypothetical protein